MNQAAAQQLRVFVELEGATSFAGSGYVSERRGVVSTTFTYDPGYQANGLAYAISPDLPLVSSSHHVTGLPRAFADSAPDRWGRNLIAKRRQATARFEGTVAPTIGEADYLLGVSDATRQGALRYATVVDGEFLTAGGDGVPALIALPRLLDAADQVSADRTNTDDLAAVKALLDAGSGSLGGARPKASVRDGHDLLMAKFPHPGDAWDVMAWEKTALDLAESAGLAVPQRRLVDVGGRQVLLLHRFDRHQHRRIGYVSALTLLAGTDGSHHDYLELAEAITEHGSAVRDDLARLWRRIAFSILINNTDDHMRNHGFLRARSGWTLSPVFDVNPDPDPGKARVSSIGFTTDPEECRSALIDSCADFRMTRADAVAVFEEVREAVRPWRQVAASNRIAASECDRFAGALDRDA